VSLLLANLETTRNARLVATKDDPATRWC